MITEETRQDTPRIMRWIQAIQILSLDLLTPVAGVCGIKMEALPVFRTNARICLVDVYRDCLLLGTHEADFGSRSQIESTIRMFSSRVEQDLGVGGLIELKGWVDEIVETEPKRNRYAQIQSRFGRASAAWTNRNLDILQMGDHAQDLYLEYTRVRDDLKIPLGFLRKDVVCGSLSAWDYVVLCCNGLLITSQDSKYIPLVDLIVLMNANFIARRFIEMISQKFPKHVDDLLRSRLLASDS